MELFKVTCVSCRARLSVRDAALVGQIVACPRCGMMVQVTAPPGTKGTTSAEADAKTPAAAATAISTANAAEQPQPTPEASLSAPSFEDAAEMLTGDEAAALHAATPPPVASQPVEQGQPAASRWVAYKFAAMIAAGAVAGSILVIGAVSLFSDGADPAATPIADDTSPSPASEPNRHAEDSPARTTQPADGLPPQPDGLAASAASGSEEGGATPLDESVRPDAYADVTNSGDSAEAASSAAPSASARTDPQAQAPSEQLTAASQRPTTADLPGTSIATSPPTEPAPPSDPPRLRIDPLDLDPEGLSLATLYSEHVDDAPIESQLPEEQPAPASESAESAEPPPPIAARRALQTVRRDAEAGVGAPPATAPLLQRKLPAVKFTNMPLCRVLDFAVQVSGLPVSAAPHELRMAGVSAATPASVDVTDATIEEVLAAALKPLRLEPTVVEDQIILHRIGEDRQRTVDYAVDDLARSPEEVEQLGQWIEQLIAPDTWQSAGGQGSLTVEGQSLRVEQAESVQYDILVMLERYRVARGLSPRSKYPASLLTPTAPTLVLYEPLSAPVTFTFTDYTPLREIFRYWQEELTVAVLVDWPALANERLWPNARIACGVADKPWAEAIDEVLRPLGLGWRAVDNRTLQITTLTKVQSDPLVEVYRLNAEAALDVDAVTARIEQAAAEAGESAAEARPKPAVAIDAAGRVLIVRQPASAHRRLVAQLSDMLAP